MGQDGTDTSIFGSEGGDVSTAGGGGSIPDVTGLPWPTWDSSGSGGGGTPPFVGSSGGSSTTTNPFVAALASIIPGIAKTTSQIALMQSNPLYHPQPGYYYQQTPQGGITVASAGAPGVPGVSPLSTFNMSSMMPLLLLGGGLVLLMGMMRR